MQVIFCPVLSAVLNSMVLFEGSQASPACPSFTFNMMMSMECWLDHNDRVKREVLGENPIPVPLCPPQIPHELAKYWARALVLRDRWLTPEPWHKM
jgi:hypothetical protein